MQVRSPELSTDQIAKWMRAAAAQPRQEQPVDRHVHPRLSIGFHPGFDFRSARQALGRARTKNDIDTIKPLRRLRRNQGAINEGLIDSLSALIAVNKQMAAEIAGLSGELAALREKLAGSDVSEDRAENR
jgi:hypothetical protein